MDARLQSCVLLWLTIAAAGCVPAGERYAGNELYAGSCSACHGIYADGTGPAAAAIPQTIPDLRLLAARNGGVFPREQVTRIVDGRDILNVHASGTMPSWGREFELTERGTSEKAQRRVQAKIDAIVDYLEEIQFDR